MSLPWFLDSWVGPASIGIWSNAAHEVWWKLSIVLDFLEYVIEPYSVTAGPLLYSTLNLILILKWFFLWNLLVSFDCCLDTLPWIFFWWFFSCTAGLISLLSTDLDLHVNSAGLLCWSPCEICWSPLLATRIFFPGFSFAGLIWFWCWTGFPCEIC